MMTNLSSISIKQLKQAVALRERIEVLQSELDAILGDSSPSTTVAVDGRKGPRRKMSAAARAKIGAAQRARWAKQKGGEAAPIAPGKPGPRKMSPAARAKIAAAARARWAKAKAANRKTLAN